MARTLVVFESMFGNTQAIAMAVADGLRAALDGEVEVVEVRGAPSSLAGVELLVVGAPTHALSLPRASTRADAATKAEGALVSPGPGVREWLAAVDAGGRTPVAATFDTRIKKPLLPGSAATAARRVLRKRGVRCVDRQSFWVTDLAGPLRDGERERARRWGVELAGAATHQAA
jgi:hypothetical protein